MSWFRHWWNSKLRQRPQRVMSPSAATRCVAATPPATRKTTEAVSGCEEATSAECQLSAAIKPVGHMTDAKALQNLADRNLRVAGVLAAMLVVSGTSRLLKRFLTTTPADQMPSTMVVMSDPIPMYSLALTICLQFAVLIYVIVYAYRRFRQPPPFTPPGAE